MNKVVFLFPGQGSQYFQMGKELFIQDQRFRAWMIALDEMVKTTLGISVVHHIYDQDRKMSEPFQHTLVTHPAIFMVEYALAQTLIEQGVRPEIVVGSSLGEFIAASVAGVIDVEEALELVMQQAKIFETYCEPGGMLAILHDPGLYHTARWLNSFSELAAINYATHFVVAGMVEHLREIEASLNGRGILCTMLPVSHAFHSAGIDRAEPYCKGLFKTKSYQRPKLPFISTRHGRSIDQITHNYLWEVVRQPMYFAHAIQTLEREGSYHYIDIGPGGTLANFTKRNLTEVSTSQCSTILSPFQQDIKNMTCILNILAN